MPSDGMEPEEALAIEAAGGAPEQAHGAWERLLKIVKFTDFNRNTQRLTPSIYLNLQGRSGVTERGRLRGAYKSAWSANHKILHVLIPVFRSLNSAKIDYRVIKGIAIQLSTNRLGGRIVGDIDLLTSRKYLDRVTTLLTENGFRCNSISECDHYSSRAPADSLDFHRDGIHVDLHVADEKEPVDLFSRMLRVPRQKTLVFGTEISLPPPELLAIHAAFHGAQAASDTDAVQSTVDLLTITSVYPNLPLAHESLLCNLPREMQDGLRSVIHVSPSPHLIAEQKILASEPKKALHFRRLVRRVRKARFLWRVRFRGAPPIVRAISNFPGRKIPYAVWLALGQFAVIERFFFSSRVGFLDFAGPEDVVTLPTNVAPFQNLQAVGVSSSPASEGTLDYRFSLNLPYSAQHLEVIFSFPKPFRQKASIYVNGSQISHIYPGDSRKSVLLSGLPRNAEISLRPSTDVCPDCFREIDTVNVQVKNT